MAEDRLYTIRVDYVDGHTVTYHNVHTWGTEATQLFAFGNYEQELWKYIPFHQIKGILVHPMDVVDPVSHSIAVEFKEVEPANG